MKHKQLQKNYFRSLQSLKSRLYSEFSWLEGRDLCVVMSKLAHYHYNHKKIMLVGRDRELYDFLLREGFHSFTVYRWLLLERVPEDIKYRLKQNEISQRRAISLAFKRKQETTETISLSVKGLGLALVRRM